MHQNEKNVTSQKTVVNLFQINFPAIPDQILLCLPVLCGQLNLGWKGIIFKLKRNYFSFISVAKALSQLKTEFHCKYSHFTLVEYKVCYAT